MVLAVGALATILSPEIQDRFKDIVKSGGENVSSLRVESVLHGHPAVEKAAAQIQRKRGAGDGEERRNTPRAAKAGLCRRNPERRVLSRLRPPREVLCAQFQLTPTLDASADELNGPGPLAPWYRSSYKISNVVTCGRPARLP